MATENTTIVIEGKDKSASSTLRKFKNEVEKTDSATKQLKEEMKKTDDASSELAKSVGVLVASMAGLYKSISSATKAYGVQEQAEIRFQRAMEMQGETVLAVVDDFKAYASSLQQITTYGDEATLAAVSRGLAMGLETTTIKETTKAAMGLASAYGVDLNTAFRLLSMAQNGQFGMMTRYGIVLDENLSKEEKFQKVLSIGSKNFSMATSDANTFNGAMTQMSNAVGDANELIGAEFAPAIKAIAGGIKDVAETFGGLPPGLRKFIVLTATITTGMYALKSAISLATIAQAKFGVTGVKGMATFKASVTAAAVSVKSLMASMWPLLAVTAAYSIASNYKDAWQQDVIDRASATSKEMALIQQQIQKEQALRREQNLGIKRIEELSKSEKLGNDERLETLKLLKTNKELYDKLGISIDENTGKIRLNANSIKDWRKENLQKDMQDNQKLLKAANADAKAATARATYAMGIQSLEFSGLADLNGYQREFANILMGKKEIEVPIVYEASKEVGFGIDAAYSNHQPKFMIKTEVTGTDAESQIKALYDFRQKLEEEGEAGRADIIRNYISSLETQLGTQKKVSEYKQSEKKLEEDFLLAEAEKARLKDENIAKIKAESALLESQFNLANKERIAELKISTGGLDEIQKQIKESEDIGIIASLMADESYSSEDLVETQKLITKEAEKQRDLLIEAYEKEQERLTNQREVAQEMLRVNNAMRTTATSGISADSSRAIEIANMKSLDDGKKYEKEIEKNTDKSNELLTKLETALDTVNANLVKNTTTLNAIKIKAL